MHIAVNTRFLLPGRLEGIGWFTYHTLKIVTKKYPEVRFTFLFDRDWDDRFIFGPNVTAVKLLPPARHPVLWYIFFEYSVNAHLNQNKYDVFLSTDGFLSLRHASTPQIAVIHDINFEHHPEFVQAMVRKYYRYFFPKYAHKASRIATVSEYSKADISKTYKIDAGKIDVVSNGASSIFRPVEAQIRLSIQKSITGGYPYFIFIGAFNPRKNLIGLFRSFDLFCHRYKTDHRLVIVGEKMHWTSDMEMVFRQMTYQDRVIFTGRKQGEELNLLLASSEALWFVSHFEGFGIPVVEAFRAGVPVLTSSATSLPEIGGDAALYCDPNDYDQIARSMYRIATDAGLKSTMVSKGLQRASLYTWENTADRLWQTITATIGR